MRLRIRADRRRAALGQTVRFELRVRSLGRYPAVGVKVCDRLPRAMEITATDAPPPPAGGPAGR